MIISLSVIKVVLPWLVAFFVGLVAAPTVIAKLHKYKCWKKKSGNKKSLGDDKGTPIFNELHKERDVSTPRMGGLVIIISVVTTITLFWLASYAMSGGPSGKLDFLSRTQTWLPLFAFLAGALVGFIDDVLTIHPDGDKGLNIRLRVAAAGGFALLAAYWFYIKLGVSEVFVPFYGHFDLGFVFIPFFIAVFIAVFATANFDGLDGLAGGVMAIIYSAFGFIAFFQDQINLAAFCFVVVGGILSFLWFNIPPARFYMTEVGYNALTFALAIVAFATDKVLLLPIIALALFVTEVTTIMQVLSKRFRGKKIFLVAPIHHHFEALGWPAHQVVMRYWIVSLIAAVLGVVLAFVS